MNENSKRYFLAYFSPLFKKEVIQQIGTIGQNHASSELIFEGTLIEQVDHNTKNFLSLLYQPNQKRILLVISVKQ